MESRPAANHRQCVVQLRTGGWDAAAASFARLMSFLPSAPPTAIQVALAGLLQAREAWDPLRAADLLESELAPCFGVEAVPREPDAELIERGGRLLASGLAPQRELQLQLASLRAREAPGGILLMGASECPLARELSQRPEPSPLYLWEADPDTPARLRAKFEDAARDVIWLTGDEVPHCDPSALPGTWMHPALHGLERDLAWRVSARVRASAARTKASQRPFPAGARRRVVILDRGRSFHGEAALFRSLDGAGHRVRLASAFGDARDEALVDELLRERPDFVLSVNGAALVQSPLVREALDATQLPTVLWFVDDPEIALRELDRFARPHILALAWERAAVARLRAAGFSGAAYLPHAALRVAKPASPWPTSGDLVWAASSYGGEDRARLAIAAGADREALVAAFAARLTADRRLDPATVRKAMLQMPEAAELGSSALFVQIAAADRVSAHRRAELARALLPLGLQIFGDAAGWKRLLGEETPVEADLHPVEQLPRLYAPGRICLDLVHAQMPTSLSQRAFDVTGGGALLLADDRPDLHEHFEVGREVLAFEEVEEAAEWVRWCRSHPDQAQAVAERGFLRTRREHRWSRRLRLLLQRVEDQFGT